MALASDGIDARYVLSGVDALHAIDGWVPHVVVLDISMPEHDGYATARVLQEHRADAQCGHHRVHGARRRLRAQGMRSGFDGYSSQKGNTPRDLVRLISRIVH